MPTIDQIKAIPYQELSKIIDSVRGRVKKHPVVIDMFDKYGVNIEEIELIPMQFGDIEVSARTDHGVITFNFKLLEDGDFEKDDHYMVHEITHFLQQTSGDKPTKASNDGNYLDNENEQEGFKNQTEFIAEENGDDAAKDYVNKVLDHHDVRDEVERKKRIKQLLELS